MVTEITYSASVDGGASIYSGGRFSTKVRSMRLSTLIKEIGNRGIDLGKFKVRVLKIDCEGCEYDVINDYEHIKHFKEIIFEYHGDASKLLKVLTKYYKCTFIRRGKCLGLVRCVRTTS